MPLVNPYPPAIQISGSTPRKVGGSPTAGSYPGDFASAFDHVHALQETSGPTNLDLGAIADDEIIRRVGAALIGRQAMMLRLSASQSTTLTTLSDVNVGLVHALKGAAGYTGIWFIYYSTAATTTGLRLSLNYSGTINTIRMGILGATSLTGFQCETATALDTPLGQATVGPGATSRLQILWADIRPATAGNLAVRYASGVAGSAVTINANSDFLIFQWA